MLGEVFEIYGKKVKVVRDGKLTSEQCEACVFYKYCDNPAPYFEEPCKDYAIGRNKHFELVEDEINSETK